MTAAADKKSKQADADFSELSYKMQIEELQKELKKKETSLKRAQTLAKNRLSELNDLKEKYETQKNTVKENETRENETEENETEENDTQKNKMQKNKMQENKNGQNDNSDELTELRARIIDLNDRIDLMNIESGRLKTVLVTRDEENRNLKNSLEQFEIQMKTVLKSNDDLQKENLRIIEDYKKIDRERLHFSNEARRFRSDLEKMKSSPLLLGTVLDVIDENHVAVRSSAGPQLIVSFSSDIDPEDLEPGVNVGMNQQTFAVADIYPDFDEPDIASMELMEECNVSYEEIGGLDDQIREIQEIVELPLTKPELFEKVGIEPPGGALLYGPPGTGKTMIAKAVANRTNATFMRVVGSELVQKYIGDGAKMVHELFDMAREKAPTIVFIDEIDAIASKRIDDGNGADREVQRTLIQLLAEMDGFTHLSNVKIIGATNRIDILDSAILRPGRFDRIIYVPLPDEKGRLSIFEIHTQKMNLGKDVDLRIIAALAKDASGADVKAITTEAGMFAIRNNRDVVLQEDFKEAVAKIMKKKNENLMPAPENMFF